ncbi:GSU2403 family nucleotidyltransferase fold protein [Mesorhizobium sp.]|uniref:GSU2403 family nucleotidyltransferase fold protein n=1 Tax=Mesorhizobium sp. TaxID=1871066 RepID=UPI0025E75DC6|nr:GSU2403 family nucleotidyltransferase fold protein [Mesorhizobium sp.]
MPDIWALGYLLHRSGVLVPSPERYAVHKLIVTSLRHENANGAAKREKDVLQARLLVEAMATARRQDDLALVFCRSMEPRRQLARCNPTRSSFTRSRSARHGRDNRSKGTFGHW